MGFFGRQTSMSNKRTALESLKKRDCFSEMLSYMLFVGSLEEKTYTWWVVLAVLNGVMMFHKKRREGAVPESSLDPLMCLKHSQR